MLVKLEVCFKSICIDIMVFDVFLEMCSYLAVSKKGATAVGLGAAFICVLTVTVPLNLLLDQYILQEGALTWLGPEFADYDLSFLSFILFIATIATMVGQTINDDKRASFTVASVSITGDCLSEFQVHFSNLVEL